eukprot:CAMPEP_0113587426 /NCGR_PEP_ID=MMETSP0015_2-20120614/34894_1 /TAXON_ID=2838 /ORGANISM="Odontella" /LENGTH=98 /DNA_ID=CAMNT_0000493069 /DNA_START=256 /DNA_END=552 /DNA_ORIENTATION=+ /assembly_acc=CAM_ASM_000160
MSFTVSRVRYAEVGVRDGRENRETYPPTLLLLETPDLPLVPYRFPEDEEDNDDTPPTDLMPPPTATHEEEGDTSTDETQSPPIPPFPSIFDGAAPPPS